MSTVKLYEDNAGGLHLTHRGMLYTNVQAPPVNCFAEDAGSIEAWGEDWKRETADRLEVTGDAFDAFGCGAVPEDSENTGLEDMVHLASYADGQVTLERSDYSGSAGMSYLGVF